MDLQALAERAFECLADDEALRGDRLTDAGFGPIMEWAADRAPAALEAAAATGPVDGTTVDSVASGLKRLVRGLVEAAEIGDAAPLAEALAGVPAAVIDTDQARAALAGVGLSGDPDENAVALLAAIGAVPPHTGSGLVAGDLTVEPATGIAGGEATAGGGSVPAEDGDAGAAAWAGSAEPASVALADDPLADAFAGQVVDDVPAPAPAEGTPGAGNVAGLEGAGDATVDAAGPGEAVPAAGAAVSADAGLAGCEVRHDGQP